MPTVKRGVCQLQKLLDQFNMSQSELERLSGVPQRSISNYVANKQVMNVDNARAIAQVFGCSIEDLCKW